MTRTSASSILSPAPLQAPTPKAKARTSPAAAPAEEAANSSRLTLPAYEKIALVLQGGGALGSYQAGVVEGLLEAGIEPDWVAGISIGALNSAIIAGNPPEKRLEALKGFWSTICQPAYLPPFMGALGPQITALSQPERKWLSMVAASRAMFEGQKGFFVPKRPDFGFGPAKPTPADVSLYDTSLLKETLLQFADFDRINNGGMRVSLGAVNVATGNFVYFDNTKIVLRPEHFMASGALPPSFPAVEIDGEYYYDGGLVSNTPLSEVLGALQHQDTLVFQVDLWSAAGSLPTDLTGVSERIKDIQYSSRTRMVTDVMEEFQRNALLVKELLALIPDEAKAGNKWVAKGEEVADSGVANIIHLIYQHKAYESHVKDFEFSLDTMNEHWLSGVNDVRNSLAKPHWLDIPKTLSGFVTHDIHRSD